jgi:hypothetical protein
LNLNFYHQTNALFLIPIQFMRRKSLLIICSGILALIILIMLITPVVVESWAKNKIQSKFRDKVQDYRLDIGNVDVSIINSGVEIKNITLTTKLKKDGIPALKVEIASFQLKGVKLMKALFRNDIEVGEVVISNSNITGKIPSRQKAPIAWVSPLNISIGHVIFDTIFLDIKSDSTAQAFRLTNGILNVYDLRVEKSDTLSPAILGQIDFDAQEFASVTSDSMFTFKALEINYSASSNTLSAKSFAIQPNYPDYEFTARHRYESDCFKAEFRQIFFQDFSAENYLKTNNLICSSVEIGEMDLKAFRDKRKEFLHIKRPTFQELIYHYPGTIDIDSVVILTGSISYTEHDEEANEAGTIWFDQFKARIYKISNDTIYKTEQAYIEVKANALLMGKGEAEIFLKGRIFDTQNTFALNGTLAGMEVKEINPILEKNAFIYATSGEIKSMNFSLTANNTKATGSLKMLYKGLHLTVKNKNTDDTTAVKEQLISAIANMKVMDSNPMPGEEVRIGIIDYERDPEKFLFNYVVKSIMSGIKSDIVKSPKR